MIEEKVKNNESENASENQNFFIADIFDALPAKCDRHTMEHPFFTLSTKMDLRTIKYEKDGVKIVVSPALEYGLPTMYDKDILLYCGSLVVAEMNKGNPRPPRTLRFSCHDLLVTTKRPTNGQSYDNLKQSFERLKGVSVSTNIKTKDVRVAGGFGLIEDWNIIEKCHVKKRMTKIEVTLSKWFYNALINQEVLTINRDYFQLRKPLERRLYELARKHCGHQEIFKINLENLQEKVGSMSPLRGFRFNLREIIETNTLEDHFPDYNIHLDDQDIVSFTQKKNSSVRPLAKPHPKSYVFDMDKAMDQITMQAQLQVFEITDKSGMDFLYLLNEFKEYISKKGILDNISGAFVTFAKKRHKEFLKSNPHLAHK